LKEGQTNSESAVINDAAPPTWLHRAPVIVIGLMGVMVAVSIILAFGPKPQMFYLQFWGTLIPSRYVYAMTANINTLLLLLPPITYQFLHGGFLHLFFNTMFLLAFGTPVALRLIDLAGNLKGSAIFLMFFLLSGVFAGMVFVLLHLNGPSSVIGASGSVSALMAAAIRVAMPMHRKPFETTPQSVAPILPITHPFVLRFTLAILMLNVLTGLAGNVFIPGGAQIAWDSHIAGYLFGLLGYPVFERLTRVG